MADLDYEEFHGGSLPSRAEARLDKARRIVNIGGAVCSVALILGLGFWGYRLAVRDVTGVPVMRALAGAMRVAPADPGGDQASHQGLSVNAVAATGTALPTAEQIVLAPRPVELQEGDLLALTEAEAPEGEAGPESTTLAGLSISGEAVSGGESGLLNADPEAPNAIDEAVALALDAPEAEVLTDAPEGALRVSLRPARRPGAGEGGAVVTDVQSVAAPGPAVEIDPATLATGTRLAQLGAFDTPEEAREKFAELQMAFGELFRAKAMVIQPAQSGGRSFYRLRAHGFEGDDEARRFCAALQSEEADCIPVAQR